LYVWQYTPTIPEFGRQRQEDYEFQVSLGYIVNAGQDPVSKKIIIQLKIICLIQCLPELGFLEENIGNGRCKSKDTQ
jgi:hypothetical protein